MSLPDRDVADAPSLHAEFVVAIGYAQPRLRVALALALAFALEDQELRACSAIVHPSPVLLSAPGRPLVPV